MPRTKHIVVKYYHFSKVVKSEILLVKRLDTANQLADILIKSRARTSLENLKKKVGVDCNVIPQKHRYDYL